MMRNAKTCNKKKWWFIAGGFYLLMLLPLHSLRGQAVFNNDSLTIAQLQGYDLFFQAMEMYPYNEKRALLVLKNAVEAYPDFVEPHYYLAQIYYHRTQEARDEYMELKQAQAIYILVEDAEKKLERLQKAFLAQAEMVVALNESCNNYMIYYYLGTYHFERRHYRKAHEYFVRFVENNNIDCQKVAESQAIIDNIEYYFWLRNNEVPFEPESLNFCTENDELFPLLSPDGYTMFYSYRYKKKVRGSPLLEDVEVFSQAPLITELSDSVERYEAGVAMPNPPFNDGRNQGAATITIDNKHLFLTICEWSRSSFSSMRNCDIFYTQKNNNGWTFLERLGTNINSPDSWEAQPSITSDGQVLFFASNRRGGFGGIDIYRSIRTPDGNWGPAQNLGETINTAGNEKAPFIHTDGMTLYFSSDGHFGMGGYDIFYSQFITGNQWTPPVNMGYPINTEEDEVGIIVNTSGNKFYFSSNNYSGQGGYDIFASELYEEAQPEKVLFVTGNLTDTRGHPVTNAMVELQNIKTLKITKGLVDSITGQYAIAEVVNEGDEFILTAKRRNMYFDSKYVYPYESTYDFTAKVDFELQAVEVGSTFKLKNIYFDTNSAEFDYRSHITLNNFLEFLQLNPTLHISLHGHTDNIGSDEDNLELSLRRAQAVYDYLIENGIEEKRLNYDGFGESQPIAPNNTPEGRATNRRTEFVVTVN